MVPLRRIQGRLTQCQDCLHPAWYGNVSLSQPAYGVVRRLNDTTELGVIQFSNPTILQTMVNKSPSTEPPTTGYGNPLPSALTSSPSSSPSPSPSSPPLGPSSSIYLDGQYATKLQVSAAESSCPFNNPSYDICGVWLRDCSAEEYASADSSTTVVITGSDSGTDPADDGQILMYTQYFNPGTSCDQAQVQLTVEADGFYSIIIVGDQDRPGVLVGYKTIGVTATDQGDMVHALNDPDNGCPCGGTWLAGVKRYLVSCPTDTCPGNEIFGAGTLGTPGYGLMQVTGGKFQMSTLKPTEAAGIYPNGRFDLSAFPFELDSVCDPGTPKTTVCGSWTQPCQPDGVVADYTVDFVYDTAGGGGLKQSYSMNRTDYTPGTGCSNTPTLSISQSGTLVKTNHTNSVSNGISVQLNPAKMTIIPHTAEIVSRIAGSCPCGITWEIGQ